MPPFNYSIVYIGHNDMARRLDEVADRARTPRGAFQNVLNYLEDVHEDHFTRLRGRYVLTGATKASLTRNFAPGAIRSIHGDGAVFGTSVEQAHYLTMAPRDPRNGQVRKPNRPDLKSAVLVFPPRAQRRVAEMILEHIVEPYE